MLNLMPIPHVLQMNEVILGPTMVVGTCSPVDRMYVTPIAILFMAENHSKTNSIGLQYQSQCCCEQEEPSQTCPSPSFPLHPAHNHQTLNF